VTFSVFVAADAYNQSFRRFFGAADVNSFLCLRHRQVCRRHYVLGSSVPECLRASGRAFYKVC